MIELFPYITINTKCSAKECIKRLNNIIIHNLDIIIESYLVGAIVKGEDALVFVPRDTNENKNIKFLLFNLNKEVQKVFIDITADGWKIKPLTYNFYVNEAKRVLLPVLRKYNEKYKTRIRLGIKANKSLNIMLPKLANNFFIGFKSGVYKRGLHPNDWKRFYRFVWHCYSRRVKLSDSDFNKLLHQNNFDPELIDIFTERFRIIMEFLRFLKKVRYW